MHVLWLHRLCRPQALPSKPQYFVSPPSRVCSVYVWEGLLSVAESLSQLWPLQLTLISFSITHLDPSSGEIADWWCVLPQRHGQDTAAAKGA